MIIFELFEQTIAPVPPGQSSGALPPTMPTTGAPAQANTATQSSMPGQQVAQPMGQTPPAQSTAPLATSTMQQGIQTSMTDLDKIAAQIVGLKQKQQQMQQQMQKSTL